MKGSKPDFVVATVIARTDGERDRWVDVGVAFHNADTDTYTVQLDAAPLNGKLVLYKPKRWVEQNPPVVHL
jgi:hypothetical protein